MKWFYQSENRRIGELPISRFFCPYPFFISSGVAALTKLFPQKNSQKAQHDAYQRSGRIDAHIKKTARPAGDKNLVQLIRHRIKGGQSPSQKGPASPPGAVQRMKQQNRQQRKFRRMRQFSDHGGRDQQPNQIKNFGKNAIAKRLGLNC